MNPTQNYHELLHKILEDGYVYEDPNRKDVFRKQINRYEMSFDLTDTLPILTTKKVYWKKAIGELLVFLSGKTDIQALQEKGVGFWSKDLDNFNKRKQTPNSNDLGKIYPYQMRNFGGEYDQIKELIKTLRGNPMATKKLVTMWNPIDNHPLKSALSPCHWSFECLVRPLSMKEQFTYLYDYNKVASNEEEMLAYYNVPQHELSLKFNMGSSDVFLGLPINLVYYGALCHLLSGLLNFKVGELHASLTNVHLYDNAIGVAKTQLTRDSNWFSQPYFTFSSKAKKLFKDFRVGVLTFDEFLLSLNIEDFEIEDYKSFEPLKAEMLAYNN